MVGVYERFTERARQVVRMAQEHARMLKHEYIGTEHILLGLLSEEEGLAADVLGSLGVTGEGARARVVEIVGSGGEVTSAQILFTPRARKVLELALREALSLGHDYVGTEHLLLGLVSEGGGLANRILLDFDADSEKIRSEVLRLLGGQVSREGRAADEGRRTARGTLKTAAQLSLEPMGLLEGLLDGAGPPLRTLMGDIEERLGRSSDAGDLLVLLAAVPEGLAARALAALGVNTEQLLQAVEEARGSDARSRLLAPAALLAEYEQARLEKEAAIEAQEFANAANLRDHERNLLKQGVWTTEGPRQDLLEQLRRCLGLTEPGPPAT